MNTLRFVKFFLKKVHEMFNFLKLFHEFSSFEETCYRSLTELLAFFNQHSTLK